MARSPPRMSSVTQKFHESEDTRHGIIIEDTKTLKKIRVKK